MKATHWYLSIRLKDGFSSLIVTIQVAHTITQRMTQPTGMNLTFLPLINSLKTQPYKRNQRLRILYLQPSVEGAYLFVLRLLGYALLFQEEKRDSLYNNNMQALLKMRCLMLLQYLMKYPLIRKILVKDVKVMMALIRSHLIH
jgi:hypothetical protein